MKQNTQNEIVSIVDEIIAKAIKMSASDIHFEPLSGQMAIKFRLDGQLQTIENLPKLISENIIARLKVLAGLLTYRNDIPQEGRIQSAKACHPDANSVTDMRLSIFPTIHGQRAVVRFFYDNTNLMELDKLGFSENILSTLQNIASLNQGILLLTGPAGSGKSTTLAAILRHILANTPGKSIVALEDPVEREIPGITQVQVADTSEMTYPVALRSLLRQDPQVLMIGEIRDAATASIVVEAGLTGHLLMSTMHSGSPAGAILRMLEMGIEPYQLTSSISAVLNQRLVRTLCTNCRTLDNATNRYTAKGCDHCLNSGYKGRKLISEIIQIDGRIRKAILAKADLDEMQNILISRGHMTMAQDAQRLINKGLTTQDEINRVLGLTND